MCYYLNVHFLCQRVNSVHIIIFNIIYLWTQALISPDMSHLSVVISVSITTLSRNEVVYPRMVVDFKGCRRKWSLQGLVWAFFVEVEKNHEEVSRLNCHPSWYSNPVPPVYTSQLLPLQSYWSEYHNLPFFMFQLRVRCIISTIQFTQPAHPIDYHNDSLNGEE